MFGVCTSRSHPLANSAWAVLAVALTSAIAAESLQPGPSGAKSASLKGELLVAMSRMPDPRFRQSVILILDHGASGAIGLIVNRPLKEVTLGDLLSGLEIPSSARDLSIPLFLGGPVEMNRLFLLHGNDFSHSSSTLVAPGVNLTMDPEMLTSIGSQEGPSQYLLAVGYAGWGPGQLEAELRQGSWMEVEMRPAWIFAEDPATTWQLIFDKHVTRF